MIKTYVEGSEIIRGLGSNMKKYHSRPPPRESPGYTISNPLVVGGIIKHAIRLPLPHIPVGNNGSGFAYSLAVDASALHQAVQRELLLANIYFSTLAKHATHPSGEMDRLATKDLQC